MIIDKACFVHLSRFSQLKIFFYHFLFLYCGIYIAGADPGEGEGAP